MKVWAREAGGEASHHGRVRRCTTMRVRRSEEVGTGYARCARCVLGVLGVLGRLSARASTARSPVCHRSPPAMQQQGGYNRKEECIQYVDGSCTLRAAAGRAGTDEIELLAASSGRWLGKRSSEEWGIKSQTDLVAMHAGCI